MVKMKLTGKLINPDIHTYYVTGSLEQKGNNQPLRKMLRKIKEGGMNGFLNDPELGNFAHGLKDSFDRDGYINKDDSLTPSGEDIVTTGKSWRSLQGAFLLTVLKYNGKVYLLDAEPVKDDHKPTDNFIGGFFDKNEFKDKEYVGIFRTIKTDEKWADWENQPKNVSVDFCFDYTKSECTVNVEFNDKSREFTTTETNDFFIINRDNAMTLLEEREKEETVFEFDAQDTTAVRIYVSEVKDIGRKPWLQDFFENGIFSLPVTDANDVVLENLCLYCNDNKTAEMLLTEYLLRKSEISYLGYEETGRFVNEFQNLFVSPDGNKPACPPIMKGTKEIYDGLVRRAKDIADKKPTAYLHLQAFIDLSPENTIKPYIEKESVVNLTDQEISFDELVTKVFGNERNIESISVFSKYTATNGRNARAFILFAESVATHFGTPPTTVITTDEVSQKSSKYQETDDSWFKKMEDCTHISLIKRKMDEIKSIHDRYYKVVRTDDSIEWWVMTGELDSLHFKNDRPRIREDVKITEKGIVKEMTFSKIKQEGVPEALKNIVEEK